MNELTFTIRRFGQPVQTIRHGHDARLEHLLVQVLLLQRGQVGFEFVFVDGFGDGHGGDGVADLLREFVLLAELFPVISPSVRSVKCPPFYKSILLWNERKAEI